MTGPGRIEAVRKHYNGPLVFARDFTVINVTRDAIVTCQAEGNGGSPTKAALIGVWVDSGPAIDQALMV
jgi:hypothetical protein